MPEPQTTELLILDDGTILVHNLTPAMAELMSLMNPEDDIMRLRAAVRGGSENPSAS